MGMNIGAGSEDGEEQHAFHQHKDDGGDDEDEAVELINPGRLIRGRLEDGRHVERDPAVGRAEHRRARWRQGNRHRDRQGCQPNKY